MRTLTLISLLLLTLAAHAAPPFIWREAESADVANCKLPLAEGKLNRQGEAENLMSGGKWVTIELDPAERPGEAPDIQLAYKLAVPKTETYRFWLRLGWEYIRMPMRWRMDGGEWGAISPRQKTRDMIELSFWCEIGWLDLGQLPLTAGAHTLELQAIEWGGDAKNKSGRLALDALAFVAGDWVPCAGLKPGEEPSQPTDVKAAAALFELPLQPGAGVRSEVSLTGLWQVCRDDDPDMTKDPYAPQTSLPPAAQQHWRGCTIPANQWQPLPAANEYAHRVWYRTRVKVPADYAGRGFYLHFFGTNWIASVVVNGQFVGSHKSVRVSWDIDISRAVKPGQINEICIGIKDLWYGIDPQGGKVLDDIRNMPLSFVEKYQKIVAPFFPSTKGDADGRICGITDWVNFVVAGPVYTERVAIRPSVAKKSLTVVATVRNPTAVPATVAVGTEALLVGGQPEHRIAPVEVTIPAGERAEVTLTAPWENPKLWWPGMDPAPIYQLRTTLTQGGKPVDVFDHEQTFGFREITVDGIYLRVNGLRYNAWNLLDAFHGDTEAELLAHFRAGNNRFERFGEDLGLRGKLGPRGYQLDWTDKHGIPGRLSSMIDGMMISYNLTNPVVWDNFSEHIAQMVLAYRNHPSVLCYSLENELLLINGRLGNRNAMPQIEERARQMQAIAHTHDPTRPCMLDGAGALKDHAMDICNTHYAEDGFFPDNARPLGDIDPSAAGVTVDPNARGANAGGFAGLWTWDRKRPYCAGEIAYLNGDNPDFCWIGGEAAAQDRVQARRAYARYVRYILERYRWNDVAMICPWVDHEQMDLVRPAMAPLAAFTREYNTSHFGGQPFRRTVKVFNDTFSKAPVTFTWRMEVEGKTVAGGTQTLPIEPGFGHEVTISATLPPVTVRTPALLVLEVTQPGSPAFSEVKACALFPAAITLKLQKPVYLLGGTPAFVQGLATLGVTAKAITNLDGMKPADGVLLIAPNAPTLPNLTAFLRSGGRVICLEQRQPLEGKALPAPLETARGAKGQTSSACWVFPTGLQTPIFAGLAESDFSNWAGFTPTAHAVWQKPVGATRPLLVCGSRLSQTALVEGRCGRGLLLASQMAIGEKWAEEPAARVLLANLLRYADGYQPPTARLCLYAQERSGLEKTIRALGGQVREDLPLEEALERPAEAPVLLVQATRDHLKALLTAKARVEAYTAAGGWLLLWGLEPEGLANFNALLGTQHVMREFRAERVRLARDPLLVGADNSDVSLLSKELLAPWATLHRVSEQTFTYCVDAGDDIAPFCVGPLNPKYEFGDGGGALATVNGLTNADFWKYILQGWPPKPGEPFVTYRLPSPTALERITVWNNANYDAIKDLDVLVDGIKVAGLVLPKGYGSAEATLGGVTAKQTVTLVPRSTYGKGGLIGLDLVLLTRRVPAWARDRVIPLTDTGGLVRYPRGKGGLVLSQLKLLESESTADRGRKQRVLAALLHNLGVVFDVPAAETAGPEAELLDEPAP
jgi:hypothetical protein